MRAITGLLTIVIVLFSPVASASDAKATMVLAIGEDQSFEPALKRLKYSALDSKRFARAMEIVSEVPGDQIQLINNVSIHEFRKSSRSVVALLKKNHAIKRFVFYFSGHSDERGLHFQDGLFSKEELHGLLKQIPTQTKISILDSCYSGALAAKGIEPAATEFTIPKSNYDEPTGTVFLTASSADEGAFESSRFGSSVFSNYLLSGLYGHADLNKDGLVTVDELYQYIYQKTRYDNLLLPQSVQQQPEFVSKLQGRGALILSMPQANLQTLHVDPRIKGDIHLQATYGLRSYVIPADQRTAQPLKLPYGEYDFSVQDAGQLGRTSIRLQPNRIASVSLNDLEWSLVKQQEGQFKGAAMPAAVAFKSPEVSTEPTPYTAPSAGSMNLSLSHAAASKSLFSPQVAMGLHSGYFNHQESGPVFSGALVTSIDKIGVVTLEPFMGISVRRNSLYTSVARGTEIGASLLAGSRVLWNPNIAQAEMYGLFGLGPSWINQHWDARGLDNENRQSTAPIGQVGIGVQRPVFASKFRMAAEYRREMTRVEDMNYGNAIAGANIYSVSVLY